MNTIYLKGGMVYNTENELFEKKNILIQNGRIVAVDINGSGEKSCQEVFDVSGKFVTPSYIDIHTHGALKLQFQRHTKEEYKKIFKHYASTGTATVFPTISTDEYDAMLEATKDLCELAAQDDTVNIDCIHYEGPFLSHAKKGAHNPSYLKNPDINFVKQALKILGNIKLRITVAPELEGAFDFIKECKKLGVMTAIGHTNADFETAKAALNLGANSFIHTFNAMSPFGHRDPGVVGAALYCEDGYPELICDGFHVDKAAVAILYKIKGDKVVLVSDSIQVAGLPENEDFTFESEGLTVIFKNGQARLPDGTIAGSTLNMHKAVTNLCSFAKIPFEKALLNATKVPAVLCGIYEKTGSLEVGKRADINVISADMNLENVFVSGKSMLK